MKKKKKNLHTIQKFLLKHIKVVVLFLVAVVLSLFAINQIVFQKPTYITVRVKGSPGNWWWVTPRPPDWLATSIQVGDKEYNAMNKPTAEVKVVDIYDAGGPTKDVLLTVKLEVRYNPNTNKYRYKGETLEIGGPIFFNLDNSFFPGMVS